MLKEREQFAAVGVDLLFLELEKVMQTDTWVKIICAPVINAVVFGIGAVSLLSTPALSAHAPYLMPAVVVVSFPISFLLAGPVARRMRLKYWGTSEWKKGDFISG